MGPKWVYSRWATESVRAFNRKAARAESVPPIEQDEIQPEKVDSGLPEDPIVPSEQAAQEQHFSERWYGLMSGAQGKGLSGQQRRTAEWNAHFDEFVEEIENLEPSGESESDLLGEKCELMGMAILLAPAGRERDRVVDLYVALLKIAPVTPETLPAWYYAVSSSIGLMQSMNEDRERVLKALENSGDPLLALVAKIHRLDPAPSVTGERFFGNLKITSF